MQLCYSTVNNCNQHQLHYIETQPWATTRDFHNEDGRQGQHGDSRGCILIKSQLSVVHKLVLFALRHAATLTECSQNNSMADSCEKYSGQRIICQPQYNRPCINILCSNGYVTLPCNNISCTYIWICAQLAIVSICSKAVITYILNLLESIMMFTKNNSTSISSANQVEMSGEIYCAIPTPAYCW